MNLGKKLYKKARQKLGRRNREQGEGHTQGFLSPHQATNRSSDFETTSVETLIDDSDVTDSDDPSLEPVEQFAGTSRRPQRSPGAEKWLECLNTLQQDEPHKYQTLERILNKANSPTNDQVESFFHLDEHNPETNVLLLRAKAVLPSLANVRAVAMTIATVDPHKVAPYVVAGSFFVLDILLGRLSLDDQRKIRNMIFDSVNAINEWISFEINFVRRGNPLVEHGVEELENLLPRLYGLAVQILCEVLAACDRNWLKAIGDKLSARMIKWQEEMEKLKDHRASWSAKRKFLEETLIRHDYTTKFLDWIKNDNDPEESMAALTDRITSEGRHGSAAKWFLGNEAFSSWSKGFTDRALGKTHMNIGPKRVLWVSGTYGTGKTTIVYRVVSELQRLADCQLPHIDVMDLEQDMDLEAPEFELKGEGLRILSYFCDSTKRVNRETVIRALGRKLAFLPDSSVARTALKFYENRSQGLRSPVYIKEWENLVFELLEQCAVMSYHIVLVIDALNECDPPEDIDLLCIFLHKIVEKYSHVSILISSHEHIPSIERLKKHMDKVRVVTNAPETEIERFIDEELRHRRTELNKLEGNKSVFFDPRHPELLADLRRALKAGANGMYIWVNVWLDVLLPLHNSSNTIRQAVYARKLLASLQQSSSSTNEASDKLRPGYERLWQFGALKGFEEKRKRLFRIVACAFGSLTITEATSMLRVGLNNEELLYDKEITTEEVEKLCSNFLIKDPSGRLHWSHDSARDFVVEFILNNPSLRSNHGLLADVFISVLQDRNHPIWEGVSFPESEFEARMNNAGLRYIIEQGEFHCRYAAEKNSILDPVWTRFFKEVVLNENSESFAWLHFGATGRSDVRRSKTKKGIPLRNSGLASYVGLVNNRPTVLMSHVFAMLDFSPKDIQDMLAKFSKRNTADLLLKSLVEHAASKNRNNQNGLVFAALTNHQLIPDLMRAIARYRNDHTYLHQLIGTTNSNTRDDPHKTPHSSETPFRILCEKLVKENSSAILETAKSLLAFEEDSKDDGKTPKFCQWSHTDMYVKKPALLMLIERESEGFLRDLLSIHKPCDPDVQSDLSGETALHYAAQKGNLAIAKILVDECHASLSVLDGRNRTPLEAACEEHGNLVELTAGLEISLGEAVESELGGGMISELDRVIEYLDMCEESLGQVER